MVGIVSDIPEIDGTQTGNVNITLTPYISDITAAGRTFNVTVLTCVDSGVTRGSSPDCESPTTQTYPNGNTFSTSGLSATNYTGAMDNITITVSNPASLISSYSTQQKYNGVNFLILFRLQSGEDSLTAIKAIPISERTTRNSNPSIDSITFNGVSISSSPSRGGGLNVNLNSGAETYQVMQADGSLITKTESLLISWFVSKGSVQPPRIVESQTSTFFPEDDSNITLIGVVRDRRGGTAVKVIAP